MHFLRGHTAIAAGGGVGAEEFVLGGDDVFDGGRLLGLLQGQGVDEDGLVRNGRRCAFEFGQMPMGPSQLPQHRRSLQFDGGWQGLKAGAHVQRKWQKPSPRIPTYCDHDWMLEKV
jgi:hypothetical protein